MTARATFARRACGLFLASTALLNAGAALAQDTSSGEQSSSSAARETAEEGEEIIVTATKRAENLQDVPIAITAFGTKTLEDNQVQQFDDYAKMIPSLSIQSAGPGASNVYFRGVASG
ncbi:MAG TPA: Plug domain-containing protein, partial [Sphingomicrobium sp.]|nr:Plug domain-containing protein [Sphingomicrobium sp.]